MLKMQNERKALPMRITINLKVDEYEALYELALRERRPLCDQAAWMIAEGLKREAEKHREPVPA
jgi:hypothetical protein